ncbi:MAG: hypothetical protein QM674_00160 [Burkholderiaceae bacterium]
MAESFDERRIGAHRQRRVLRREHPAELPRIETRFERDPLELAEREGERQVDQYRRAGVADARRRRQRASRLLALVAEQRDPGQTSGAQRRRQPLLRFRRRPRRDPLQIDALSGDVGMETIALPGPMRMPAERGDRHRQEGGDRPADGLLALAQQGGGGGDHFGRQHRTHRVDQVRRHGTSLQ